VTSTIKPNTTVAAKDRSILFMMDAPCWRATFPHGLTEQAEHLKRLCLNLCDGMFKLGHLCSLVAIRVA
jgi:hypothetical protein